MGRPLAEPAGAGDGTAELAGDLLLGGFPLPGVGVRPESEDATLDGEAGDFSDNLALPT